MPAKRVGITEGGLFASPTFLRLWMLGGIVNAMRWVEMLAAGLFTWQATGSGVAVSMVLAARSLPMLCFGAFAGLACDCWNRKRVVFFGLLVSAASAASVTTLALLGEIKPWQIGMAAFVSGSIWATELPGRRRMIGEFGGVTLVSRVVALDSLTNSLARIVGPLLGSLAYAGLGLPGAYAISAACYLLGALLVPGIMHTQATYALSVKRVARDLAQGAIYAVRHRTVLAVLGVTVAMNLFAFSYTAIVPPLARVGFGVSEAMVGFLPACEPLGTLLGGLVLARWTPPFDPRLMLIGGSATFLSGLALMSFMPSYGLACAVLVLGGLGLALFSNMQTSLILIRAPAAIRSRQMGLITACIGVAPIGQVVIGGLAEAFGPLSAVALSAATGLVGLAAIAATTGSVSPEPEHDDAEA